MSANYVIGAELVEQVIEALDTAGGCLMLVASDCKPTDLAECRQEIEAAYDALRAIVSEQMGSEPR